MNKPLKSANLSYYRDIRRKKRRAKLGKKSLPATLVMECFDFYGVSAIGKDAIIVNSLN